MYPEKQCIGIERNLPTNVSREVWFKLWGGLQMRKWWL